MARWRAGWEGLRLSGARAASYAGWVWGVGGMFVEEKRPRVRVGQVVSR